MLFHPRSSYATVVKPALDHWSRLRLSTVKSSWTLSVFDWIDKL